MGISRNSSFNFDLDFANYGEDEDLIATEVKRDVTRLLQTVLQSRFFNRSEGAGIETLENEKLSETDFALYKFQIVNGLLTYNNTVTAERQIAVSQDLISIEEGSNPGELYIKVVFFLVKDANSSQPVPQEIAAALNVG